MNLSNFLTDRAGSYIERWHHRPFIWKENLAEHHCHVARTAYWLAYLIGLPFPEDVAIQALYHDEPEVITGDIPHPTKKFPGARKAIDGWEMEATKQLVGAAPEAIQQKYGEILGASSDTTLGLVHEVITYADDLAALSFVQDQVEAGMHSEEVLTLHGKLIKHCHDRNYLWLQKLREDYPDLP